MKTSTTITIVAIAVVCAGALAYAASLWNKEVVLEENEISSAGKPLNTEDSAGPEIIVDKDKLDSLPKPDVDAQTADEAGETQETKPVGSLPEKISLDIPFYAQAPDGNWELPWKEACEESSIILAHYYLVDASLSLAKFKEEVISMTKLQEDMFGSAIDTSVAQTQELYVKYYGDTNETKIMNNPTVDQIKSELAQGHVIVAPFAGKKLGNSNFTNGGPRYHMLVIRGYDEKYFYTNDVGTRLGENFPYSYAVIMDALHDLVPEGKGDIATGKKRILVLMKK